MEFVRQKQRGLNQKTNKLWLSPCGNYRIDWACEFAGVSIDPRFTACVLSYGNTYGDQTFWNFAGKRGPYRTFNAAVEACEKNERLWKHVIQVCEGERKGRNEKLRVIDIKARIGTGPLCNRVLSIIPSWVRNVGNPVLMNQLFPRYESRPKDEEEDEADESTPAPVEDDIDLTVSDEPVTAPAKPVKKPKKVAAEKPAKKPAKKAAKKPAKKATDE